MSAGQGEGWYADPQDARRLRWWDGQQWTGHTHHTAPLYTAPPRPDLPRRWGLISVLTQLALVGMVVVCGYGLWVDREVLAFDEEVRLRPDTVSLADRDRIDGLLASTLLATVWMLVTGILFITWLYTAHRSSRMERSVIRHDSGWAIGSWFVPVMNFWQPFLMVTDVRRGATGDPATRPSLSQGWWWGLFAGQYVLGWGAQLQAFARGTAAPEAQTFGYSRLVAEVAEVHQWTSLVTIAAAVMAIVVVRDVTRLVLAPPPGRVPA
jgi:hypothetical protein